jgi:hypothetical protein
MASSVVSQAKQTLNDAAGLGLSQLAAMHVNVPMILGVLGLAAIAYTCRERIAKLARGI